MKTQPLPLEVAQKLLEYKMEHNLSYAKLGERVGISGSLLSSRVVHCSGNPDNKVLQPLSCRAIRKIQNFLGTNNNKAPAEQPVFTPTPVKEPEMQNNKPRFGRKMVRLIETAELIVELKRRGAVSIAF